VSVTLLIENPRALLFQSILFSRALHFRESFNANQTIQIQSQSTPYVPSSHLQMRPTVFLLFILFWLSTTTGVAAAASDTRRTRPSSTLGRPPHAGRARANRCRRHRHHPRRLHHHPAESPPAAKGEWITRAEAAELVPPGSPAPPWVVTETPTPIVLGLAATMVTKGIFDIWQSPRPENFAKGPPARPTFYLHTTVLYAVSHSDPIHSLVNLALTYGYGRRVEQRYGSRRTLMLLIGSVVGGGIINLIGCTFFNQRPGKGSSGISLSFLSAFAVGRLLDAAAVGGARRRSPSMARHFWWEMRCRLQLLLLKLVLQDGGSLSVWIHAYGVVAGAVFALLLHDPSG
jgi:membrane associated rhomboid family serine protease